MRLDNARTAKDDNRVIDLVALQQHLDFEILQLKAQSAALILLQEGKILIRLAIALGRQ